MKSDSAQAAKAIRKELKAKFPEIKFSVTSDNFAGGNAVRIRYTDGVLIKEIEAITDKYQYGSFNGMEDIYEFDNTRQDLPQAKFVTVNRDMSEQTRLSIVEEVKTTYHGGENYSEDGYSNEHGCYWNQLIYRLFVQRDYSKALIAD